MTSVIAGAVTIFSVNLHYLPDIATAFAEKRLPLLKALQIA